MKGKFKEGVVLYQSENCIILGKENGTFEYIRFGKPEKINRMVSRVNYPDDRMNGHFAKVEKIVFCDEKGKPTKSIYAGFGRFGKRWFVSDPKEREDP